MPQNPHNLGTTVGFPLQSPLAAQLELDASFSIMKTRKHHMQVKVPFLHDWPRVLGQIPDQGWLQLVDVLWQCQDYNVLQSATCPVLRSFLGRRDL